MTSTNNAPAIFSYYTQVFEPTEISPTFGYTTKEPKAVRAVEAQAPEESHQEFPPQQWVARIALACIEVLHGKRSVAQIRKICSHRVAQDLLIKQSVLSARKNWGAIRITKVKYAIGIKDSVEVTINFEHKTKVYPMALNLSQTKEGWKIQACEIGPH